MVQIGARLTEPLRPKLVLHPQSMRPAREGDIPVRVKNSYNPQAPGTLIARSRELSADLSTCKNYQLKTYRLHEMCSIFQHQAVLTSIVLKRNITMLDIVGTRTLGQFGFLAKVFSVFEDLGIYLLMLLLLVKVGISLTLDPSKLWSKELIQQVNQTSFPPPNRKREIGFRGWFRQLQTIMVPSCLYLQARVCV